MQRVFLINPLTIKELTNISVNMSDKMLDVAIKESQDTELNEILGTKLLYKLYDLVASGDIKNTDNSLYKELLDYHVSYFLTYNAISRLIVIASIKIDNIGLVTTGDEKVNSLPVKDIFALEGYYRGKSDFYKSRLQAYLRLHRDDFRELQYHDAYNTLAAIETAYTSSVFLGGRRGKKIYKPCYCKPAEPHKPVVYHTVNYIVDHVVYLSKKYAEGEFIEHIEAPTKEGQYFNVWVYEKDGAWHNLPDYMGDFDIDCFAHYLPIEGESWTYRIDYRVPDGYSDADVSFDNCIFINDPFEWLQVIEKEYNPYTREGWVKLTHPSLRFDTAITVRRFNGCGILEKIDLHELNNCSLTDRIFADNQYLTEIIPPKGLIRLEGYDFMGCRNLRSMNFKTDGDYTSYQPYANPATGAFNGCYSLESLQCDGQRFIYSDNGNIYNMDNNLMNARANEVTLREDTTAILSESLKDRNLKTLTIPSSVTRIEYYAICDNYELTDVYYTGTMDEWARIEKPEVNTIFVNTQVQVIHCSDGDCPIDYQGSEPMQFKIDVYLEWDYYTTQWYYQGDLIVLPEPPVREGFTFSNWNFSNGTEWIDEQQYMPAYNLQVHATYLPNE